MVTSGRLGDLVPILSSLTGLTTLTLSKIDPPNPKKSPTSILTAALPHLKKIQCMRQPYCNNMERLIRIVAPQLSCLTIQVTVSQVAEIVGLLPLLVHLQGLGVYSYDGHGVAKDSCPVYNRIMPHMDTLTVCVAIFQQYDTHIHSTSYLQRLKYCIRA